MKLGFRYQEGLHFKTKSDAKQLPRKALLYERGVSSKNFIGLAGNPLDNARTLQYVAFVLKEGKILCRLCKAEWTPNSSQLGLLWWGKNDLHRRHQTVSVR